MRAYRDSSGRQDGAVQQSLGGAPGKRTLVEQLYADHAPGEGLAEERFEAPGAFGAPDAEELAVTEGPGAVPHPTVRRGSQGDAVRECQRKLNLRGAQLIEDGAFGGQTDAAVRRFQSGEGIDADGVVGPITWGRLDAGLAATTKTDPPPAGNLPGSHQVPPTSAAHKQAEQLMDDAGLVAKYLMADTSEFASYVSTGVLDAQLAGTLALMRDLGGDTQYGYELAKNGLSDGTLLGLVFNANRATLINRAVGPNDPDRALLSSYRATNNGMVFGADRARRRGLILVGDSHDPGSRSMMVDLCHELTHYRNRATGAAIEADTSHDLSAGVPTLTAAQMAETRLKFVDEVGARHVEWWAAWTIRQDRLGGKVADITVPTGQQLFDACVDLASNFASDPIYDPFGYWAALMSRGNADLETQVGQWLSFVKLQTLSGNPYRDMASQAAFDAASRIRTSTGNGDGLGSNI